MSGSGGKKLVVWVDDLIDSGQFGSQLAPIRTVLAAECELLVATSVSGFAAILKRLMRQGRRVDGLLLDMMLTSNTGEQYFGELGLGSIPIVPHSAGAQLARIFLADQYRFSTGDTPAANFIEYHCGCSIAVMSTCYESSGAELFERVDAGDIRGRITEIYESIRKRQATNLSLQQWLGELA